MLTPRDEILDKESQIVFGRKRSECLANKICVKCGESAVEFKDELSKKEYQISAFCQKCQDEFFGSEDE